MKQIKGVIFTAQVTVLDFNERGGAFPLRRGKEFKVSVNTSYWLGWSDSGHIMDLLCF